MKKFEIKIIKDIKEAKRAWNALTANETLYDNWDYRYCFYKYYNYELFFYAGYLDGKLIGLLPLQYNSDDGCIEFFAEEFTESNHVLIKPGNERFIAGLYKAVKPGTKLLYIIKDNEFLNGFRLEEYKYVINLTKIKNSSDYIESVFQGKEKKNIKREIRIIGEKNPEIAVNGAGDLPILFDLNIKNFGKDSNFNLINWRKGTADLLRLDFNIHILAITIDGKKQAVSLVIFYNNVYYLLATGSNNKDVPNLGKYLIVKNIDYAKNLGATALDASIGDCHWKKRWHLDRIPQYKYYKLK